MKTPQKGFSTIFLIVFVILLITIGYYIWLQSKSQSNNEVQTRVQGQVVPSASTKVSQEIMIGTWRSGASDSGSVLLELNPAGSFVIKEIYSYIEAGDYPEGYKFPKPTKTEGSGTWSVETDNGQSYLSLKFDKKLKYVPDTAEQIKEYKDWGQEFIGTNEVRIKLEYPKDSSMPGFWYDGFLMQKQVIVKTQASSSNPKESFISKKDTLYIPVEFQRNGVTAIEYSILYGQKDKKTDAEKKERKQMWVDLANYTLNVARCPKDKENSPSCALIQQHGDCGFVESIWVKKEYQASTPTFLDQIRKASFREFPYVLEC